MKAALCLFVALIAGTGCSITDAPVSDPKCSALYEGTRVQVYIGPRIGPRIQVYVGPTHKSQYQRHPHYGPVYGPYYGPHPRPYYGPYYGPYHGPRYYPCHRAPHRR